jgi:hypothetical protein
MNKGEREFKSKWWSVRLPIGWQATESKECVTLQGTRLPSALQISAAIKDAGLVTDEDLTEFATERLGERIALHEAALPEFAGFWAERVENGTYWQEWWLRHGNVLVYVTYNINEAFQKSESAEVSNIVRSLKPLNEVEDSVS